MHIFCKMTYFAKYLTYMLYVQIIISANNRSEIIVLFYTLFILYSRLMFCIVDHSKTETDC